MSTTTFGGSGVTIDKGPKFVLYDGKRSDPYTISRALRSLVLLLRNGMRESLALEIAGESFAKYKIGRGLKDASRRMNDEGLTFVEALTIQDALPRESRELIAAGSSSSSVYDNIEKAAELLIDGVAIRKRIFTPMITPMITLVVALGIVTFAALFALPNLADTLSGLNAGELPGMSSAMMVFGIAKWVSIALLAALVLGLLFWVTVGRNVPKVRRAVSAATLRVPVVGRILSLVATARLFQLASANLSTGMREADALESAGRGCGEEALAQHMVAFAERMRSENPPETNEFANTPYVRDDISSLVATADTSSSLLKIMTSLHPSLSQEADLEMDQLESTFVPIVQYAIYGLIVAMMLVLLVPFLGYISVFTSLV